LREWSSAVLPAVADRLQEITMPVLWIAGERDRRYVEEGRRAVALLPDAELWICPDAGHRVPWEQPDLFVRRLRTL
jgi:2-succinyl-6-hydroxy-2,4-cyclohexadiene-1-carboxylate synthase